MMASNRSICFDNVAQLEDIDIDMEVKSEYDSDEELDCTSKVNGFDVEFIIPEQQQPEELISEEPVLETDQNSHNLSDCDIETNSDICSSEDEDVQDEPEVEIDEVTVQQELVEVTLDPSLLLFVKHEKKPSQENHQQTKQECERSVAYSPMSKTSDLSEQTINSDKFPQDDQPLRATLFPSLSTPNTRNKGNAVTAALRKVKRKPYREPLEPLNQIECSSNNVYNSRNGDKLINENKNCRLDNVVIENDSDDNDRDTFSGPPSSHDSDSEAKEQKDAVIKSPVITKKKRGRPRLKRLDFSERISIKRKYKNRKVRKKVKVKHKSHKMKALSEIKEDFVERNQALSDLSNAVEEVVNNVAKEISELNGVISDISNLESVSLDKQPAEEKKKKERKIKSEKKKPTIFDEVKLDYTVLNENEPKQKPKRVRKRDKKSREMAALSKPESFDCTECGRKFKEKSHLATHARAHINIRNFKCNRCGNLFKTKTSLFFHMKTHSDAPFTCEKCNKTYPERRMLMRHIRVVHSSQNSYSCDQCGREFKSMNNLNLHYTLHTGIKPFTCDNCGKSFVYKSTYIAHMKAHDADNSFNCELCPKTYNNKAEFRRLCNHHSEARPWLCTVCGKGYPLKGTLKNHMKTHEPEKPYKCTECPKSFMKKQSFECHLKMHAGESPQFMCDQCSQSYFNVFALKRHYLKHTSERKYVCEVCSKAFWMKDALKVHMRTHSTIKMFPCVHCSKAFAHKHSLDAHLRTHSEQIQPYSCNVCQKTFIHKYNLARHERQHILASSMTMMPSSVVPPGPQPLPVSVMMLPPLPSSTTSTTLHIL